MTSLRTSLLVAASAVLAALIVPAAAHADMIYPPSDACSVASSTVAPGGSVAFTCDEGTFAANEPVTITLTGENGAQASFGFVRFAVSTGSTRTESGDAGELGTVSITLPTDARGVYNIAAVSASSPGGTASVTVVADGETLPDSGGDGQAIALWAGGAVLLLVGGLLALMAARRTRRDRH